MRKVAAIVLAAGRASRFGVGPTDSKVLARLDGRPLVRHVVETALASRAAATYVVTGQAAARVATAVADLAVTFVSNAEYDRGISTSVRAGLAALSPDFDGALMLLADMPCVAASTLDALIAAFSLPESAPDAVVPVLGGRRGNPALIGRTLFDEVARLEGDAGAQTILLQPGRTIIACPVDDPGIAVDVDTRDALRGLAAEDGSA